MINKYSKLTAVWAIFAATLTSLPGALVPRITGWANFILDNVTHFTVFLVLAFLMAKSLKLAPKPLMQKHHIVISILVCSVYGIVLELIQIPIPGRAFEWSDSLANMTGAISGVAIMHFLRPAS